MRSLLLAILTGLVGAALMHIVIILGVPHFATNDTWSRLEALPPAADFVLLESAATAPLAGPLTTGAVPAPAIVSGPPIVARAASASADRADRSTFTRAAICRFEMDGAPIRLAAAGNVPFWSLGIFDRQSNEIFSMNDRTATDGALDVTIASPLDMIALRDTLPDALAQSVLVEMDAAEGYAVLRTVIPDATYDAAADAFLGSAECAALPQG